MNVWAGERRLEISDENPNPRLDRVEISSLAATGLQAAVPEQTLEINLQDAVDLDSELMLLEMLMEKVLGREVKLGEATFLAPDSGQTARTAEGVLTSAQNGQAPARQGWGLAYDYHESYYESERTQFTAQGTVSTADGREIAFNLALDMDREFYREQNLSVRMGDALIDPLTLNFGGTAAQLTDARFKFDLDADGRKDDISFLSSNSGFLAFDRNGDGVINDGSELFGPTTGDGFAELAAYDEDDNQFIDEADSIYGQLKVFNKDAAGVDRLQTLRERNVGAIYLGSTSTEFSLKDGENGDLGRIRETGVFIDEEGGVGTVQQLDLSA